jgi:integrase
MTSQPTTPTSEVQTAIVELRAALEQADPTRRCWILLAVLMGLSCQEIARLRWNDVLDSKGLMRVAKVKGGAERFHPLHPEVLTALRALPMARVGWVFIRPRGGPYPAAQLSHAFNNFLRSAGVSGSADTLRFLSLARQSTGRSPATH